jgi:acetyltransferase-like isoleucine patch superfamily enzyme
MAEQILGSGTLDRWRADLRGSVRALRRLLPDLIPLYWRWVYFRGGIEGINALLITEKRRVVDILRLFGAVVGEDCSIYGPLFINTFTNYANLKLGRHVHIGQCVFLDLGGSLSIEDEATVSMRCTLLTHQAVGDRPLAKRYPRKEGPVTVGRGAYLGAGVIVLPGSSIGAGSVVGAGSLVLETVPDGVVAAGSPAEIKSRL